jgi:hypothetical protein
MLIESLPVKQTITSVNNVMMICDFIIVYRLDINYQHKDINTDLVSNMIMDYIPSRVRSFSFTDSFSFFISFSLSFFITCVS